MPLPVYRLRRILAATAVLLTLSMAGMIFYARSRINALRTIPGKMGYGVIKTASGFQFSKSDGKRTLFTVQASNVKEFKLNGNAELHNVSIILYGRDSSRFDQIYGDDFAYDQRTGDVTANGEVQIDLVANPAGLASPDQATPKELKNPIHLRTRNLIFNKNTGDAFTAARVEFRTPQANGWADGVKYSGKSNTLTLSSHIHLELSGPESGVIEAEHGTVTNDPRQIVLDHPHLDRSSGTADADRAVFDLTPDNHVERVLAVGNVRAVARSNPPSRTTSKQPPETRAHANEAEFSFAKGQDVLRTAVLRGGVHIEQSGAQPLEGDAGRLLLDFAGQNQLQRVHAVDGVHLVEKAVSANPAGNKKGSSPDFHLRAPVIDFVVAEGHVLKHATTSGPPEITIAQPGIASQAPDETVVTAGKFDADFAEAGGHNHLAKVHGAPDARVVNSSPGEPARTSTSDSIDAFFAPQGGIESLTQTGNFHYTDSGTADHQVQAWSSSARYTPADHMLVLNGSPRIENGGMMTTANTMRINRSSGDASVEGEVKSTYSELKEQPNGALLASSSPIHVTAQKMTAHKNPGVALYTGNARLWQDTNIIEAPSIQFDRDRRSVVALGAANRPVQTTLVQVEKPGQTSLPKAKPVTGKTSSPIFITALKLTYVDSERKVHYEGGVTAKGEGFTAVAKTTDAYLLARAQSRNGQTAGPGQLDRMVAEGGVTVEQPSRRAEGEKLVYTAAEDEFVLTGGPPSIFDAEQGKITGVSLTFFRRDDRVLVEGEASPPVVRQSRMAQ